MFERGLLISPPIEISGSSLYVKSSNFDAQEMRSNLLFWDKLDWPDQRIIGFGSNPDVEYLMNEGVLQRTRVDFHGGGDMVQLFRMAHMTAFRALNEVEPGRWSFASGENSISLPEEDVDDNRGVLVRLHQAIPVPNSDVPYADVLEFRERRRPELVALRHHLEDVYQKIISSGDEKLAMNTEIERLQLAIRDHIKVSEESRMRLRLSSLTANLNILPIAMGVISSSALGLPILGEVLTGLSSSISIDSGIGLKRNAVSSTPFRYISSYNKELFITP